MVVQMLFFVMLLFSLLVPILQLFNEHCKFLVYFKSKDTDFYHVAWQNCFNSLSFSRFHIRSQSDWETSSPMVLNFISSIAKLTDWPYRLDSLPHKVMPIYFKWSHVWAPQSNIKTWLWNLSHLQHLYSCSAL